MSRHVVLRISVPAGDVDLASGELWATEVQGIEERASSRVEATTVDLVAAFGDRAAAERAELVLAGRWPAVIEEVIGDDWLDGWRRFAAPVRAGTHFLVVPAWPSSGVDPPPPARAGDVVVRIDPGRAFGSGSHPTTRLVLAEVERLVGPGTRVLDVGCGSGVLAVAAALRGATPVVAIDVDPAAVDATRRNAGANGVAGSVHPSSAPLGAVDGRFDVVLANLPASTIRERAGDLAARTFPGATLVLSGILDGTWHETAPHFAAWELAASDRLDGWAVVTLTRSG